MKRLKDRLALVTGASSGIGEATARALAHEGAEVLLAARRVDKLAELATELPRARVLELDVRDAMAVAEALVEEPVDLAVLNAGMALGTEGLQDGAPEEWSTVIDTNVKGVLNVMRAVLPDMIAAGRGDIVFLGSVAGRWVYKGGGVYCATKHAVRALYESARLDAAGSGVRFTSVDPGMVETDFSRVRFRGDQAAADAVYAGMTPLEPSDVADVIRFAVTRPPHVNVGEVVLWPTDQASCTVVRRDL
jgi:3-hydroxy acid dehydrogenase/malonic semialdehyde reductase